VGYSIDSRMKSRIAVNALTNAVTRRGNVAGCVLHTDRGSQFRSRKFVGALNRRHMVGSMGRRCSGRQRSYGVLLQPAAEERPRQTLLGHSRGTPDRDRQVDRGDLPPPPKAVRPRQIDPGRMLYQSTQPAVAYSSRRWSCRGRRGRRWCGCTRPCTGR
jgi:hypothetical protein